MAGLSSILELGKRSLGTNQYGINVTSHNISNASTPGYSRQRLNVVPAQPERYSFGYIGSGVDIDSVQRLRETYIDQQVYTVNQTMGRASQRENILRLTESFLQEPSDSGLSAMLSEFYGSFQDLSLHPEESANRNDVVQRATLLTGAFRRITDSIDSLKKDVLKEAETKVEKINKMVETIAGLDRSIMVATASGPIPNDLLDQRDQQVNELSGLVDLGVTAEANGSVSLSVGGTMIVAGGRSLDLSTEMNGDQLTVKASGINQPLRVTGGELNAVVTLHNETFNGYLSQLDELATSIIDNVNAVHRTGYGLGSPAPTGKDFFTGTNARTIDLSADILSSINNIAASSDGKPGNNETAVQIANLQTKAVMTGGTNTMSQFYSSFVSRMGSDIEAVAAENESSTMVKEQLTTQQNSVSGVSLDEEMTQLIKYQHGFDAAARVITTVNDMFQTILSM